MAYILRKRLIKPYMRDKCEQFVNTYCPVYAYALAKCLDSDHQHRDACRDILRDQDNTDNLKAALTNYRRLVNKIMDRPLLCYSLHLSNIGWTTSQIEGSIIGAPHSGESIEAIKIKFDAPYKKVEYAVKTNEDGWLCAENGEMAGTTGNSRPIHGIRIHIPEAPSDFLRFRIHFAKHWSKWCANGQAVEFPNFIASALQIELMK